MKTLLVIVLAAAVAGGLAGAAVGIALDGDSSGTTAASPAAAEALSADAHRAWLGVEVETIDPALTDLVRGRLPASGAVVVRVMKGSPAAKGLKPPTHDETFDGVSALLGGDVIVGVDGEEIGSSQQLSAIVAQHQPGDQLTLEVVRRGKDYRTVKVTLGDVPAHGS